MPNADVYDEFDGGINALMAGREFASDDMELAELLEIAGELRSMPSPEFKLRLLEELMDAAITGLRPIPVLGREEVILPTLFGVGATYPVRRGSFVASYLAQAAMLALIASSGFWMVKHHEDLKQQLNSAIEIAPYVLPPNAKVSGGGGGGGDRDKLEASKGALPKTARDQITPPAIVIRSDSPVLPVPPTVVAPQLNIPQVGPLGDVVSHILGPASNGTGYGGGIGSGSGTGVGSGNGPGVGPGFGGGIGGGAYRIGGGVSAPVPIYDPDPEYSDEARKAKYQGTVVLWVVIGPDGRPRDMRVERSLGMGLDEKAMDAVKKWRFRPAMKDNQPVPVQVNIEVSFRLY
ncbi:MAG TPA: energy transducer TonB [Terriglobales bacterium]|nr:energy transducer TonB [Terriglobales bacterium]